MVGIELYCQFTLTDELEVMSSAVAEQIPTAFVDIGMTNGDDYTFIVLDREDTVKLRDYLTKLLGE
jgi:hypothetical protein